MADAAAGLERRFLRAVEEDVPVARVRVISAGGASGAPEAASLLVLAGEEEDAVGADVLPEPLAAVVVRDARELLAQGRSRTLRYRRQREGGAYRRVDRLKYRLPDDPRGPGTEGLPEVEPREVDVFVDAVRPPARLMIFGAGHDAIPVSRVGAIAGFRVTVVDSRKRYATDDRFPAAETCIVAAPPRLGDHVTLDADTYCVVMTHNYVEDVVITGHLLDSDVPYIGMLGPKERAEQILDELRDDGMEVEDRDLDRIYAPVGLDIGGERPEHIALSVVSEVMTVSEGRTVQHLRERKGPIHAR